jgi:hypothetical protein
LGQEVLIFFPFDFFCYYQLWLLMVYYLDIYITY